MEKIKDRKEQFLQHKTSKLPLILGVIAVAAAGGFLLFTFFPRNGAAPAKTRGEPVAAARSYVGKVEQMKPIQPVVKDGMIQLNLADVDKANMVGFEMENDTGFLVPMMAYISTSGRLFIGCSLCECGGRTFSLAGRALVCNTCRTTYDIENQTFISGVSICGKYPPVNMKSTVENGMIRIDQSNVLKWRIRAGK